MSDSIDAAWAAAEAALPEGHTLAVSTTAGNESWPYVAVTDIQGFYAYATDPAAALRALADKLLAERWLRTADPDTQRAIRAGLALPGTLEDDIARWPADRVFDDGDEDRR